MNSPSPFPPRFAVDYNDQRWRQLNALIISHSEGALNYLLAVNGGALAGMLAFIGAVAEIRQSSAALAALTIFTTGLVLAGVCRANALETMKALQAGWMSDFRSYLSQQITWDELVRRDEERVKVKERWGPILGYGSFVMFILGLGLATHALLHLPVKAI
ncbi:hypothetical protein [Cupriavidus oxalaticus]|uniref:hypothetical protein n=1 Tax=Cupriavidus oxalaticus TaxID=96344 RepID=UPI00403429EF